MLRKQILPLIRHQPYSMYILGYISNNYHTTQVFSGKCKKKRKKATPKPVAMILCGCGAYDGTDISEALCSIIHLHQRGLEPHFFAPDAEICETVDHRNKEPDPDSPSRNAAIESARIAKSCVRPLCQCEACQYQALVIPGGFGVTKTLSDFHCKGANCTVIPELEKIIEDFYCGKKPIATMCIASILVARVLKGCKVTFGRESPKSEWPYADVIKKAQEMGAKVEIKGGKGITRCKTYNVLSTPAWMHYCATYPEIYFSIGKLIAMLKKTINAK